jgi:outer membrane protein assembly factor BamB
MLTERCTLRLTNLSNLCSSEASARLVEKADSRWSLLNIVRSFVGHVRTSVLKGTPMIAAAQNVLFRWLCCSMMLCTTSLLSAAEWSGWRGPHSSGLADGTGYPISWSATENLIWSADISGLGGSTPAVAGDSIFITTTDNDENTVVCFGLDGKHRWSKAVGAAVAGKPGKDGTGANPSVTTDGELLFAYFKSGDLACFTVTGELQWQTNLQERYGEDTLWWDLGTSPVLVKNAVVIACMHSGPSYVAAFGRKDGKLLWKHDRELGAPEEAAQSYSTPIVIRENDQEVLVVLGADHVTAHSTEDGKELWRVGGLNPTGHKYFRSIASPSAADGIVIAPYARGNSLTAIRVGGTGNVTKSHVIWTNPATSADVPTPVVADGRVFVCRDVDRARGTIDCLDVTTGKSIWSGQLEEHRTTYRSSPVLADGRLYVTRQDGTVFVLDAAGPEFKVLSKNVIAEEHTVATPVFIDGKILLRSNTRMHLIGKL